MEKSQGQHFITTEWSVILGGAEDSQGAISKSLSQLCENYRSPILSFFRHHCHDPSEAEDLCQGFFEKLIRDRSYSQATPERGRFRSFLIAAAKHYFLNQRRNAKAQKRGAGTAHLSLEDENSGLDNQLSDADNSPADEDFDHEWANTVFKTVWDHLESTYRELGQLERFVALRPFLVDPENAPAHKSLAEELGISTSAIKSAAFELRKRFRETFRTIVARLVDDPSEVDDEVRYLVQVIAKRS